MGNQRQNKRSSRGGTHARRSNSEIVSRRIPFLGVLRVEVERPTKKKPRPKKKGAGRASGENTLWGRMAYWSAVCGLWALVGFGGLILYYAMTLPSTDNLWDLDTTPGVTVIAADGTPIVTSTTVPTVPQWGSWTSLKQNS